MAYSKNEGGENPEREREGGGGESAKERKSVKKEPTVVPY
jgi:hypothetical protein